MTAWCHGTPGVLIPLVLLYKYEPTAKTLSRIEKLLIKILETQKNSKEYPIICLCHGIPGNLDILFDILKIEELKAYHPKINSLLTKTKEELSNTLRNNSFINNLINLPNDFSMMTGLAGVGYFFLRLINSLINNQNLKDYSCFIGVKTKPILNSQLISS